MEWGGEERKIEKKTQSIFHRGYCYSLLIARSIIFICPSFSLCLCMCVCMCVHTSTYLHCSGKQDLNIFRLTVSVICIPLTHSEQRHLSRNTADKKETINPMKITGTEFLSSLLTAMRQRSYYLHPTGLASESKQCSR